ncbi:hypothetical protein DL95DRAFT_464100 [Leptodontidium sp. 2 PMI_412]|nr:hypothetical protein DL95DRAFT_464100 [Leptodontidium sp. 2 PMI_412]
MNNPLPNPSPNSPRTLIQKRQRSRDLQLEVERQIERQQMQIEAEAAQEIDQEIDQIYTLRRRRYSFGSTTPTSPPFLNAPPSTPYTPGEEGEGRGEDASPSSMAYLNANAGADRNINAGSNLMRNYWSWKRYFLAGFIVVLGVVLLGAKEDDMRGEGAGSGSGSGGVVGVVSWVVLLGLVGVGAYLVICVGLEIVAEKDEAARYEEQYELQYEDEDEDEDEDEEEVEEVISHVSGSDWDRRAAREGW